MKTRLALASLVLLATLHRAAPASETPCFKVFSTALKQERDREMARLSEWEAKTVQGFEDQPTTVFLGLRHSVAHSKANEDFPFPQLEPVLRKILLDSEIRSEEKLSDENRAHLLAVIAKGKDLLDRGIPYKESVRFGFEYLYALDGIFLNFHSHLTGTYHRNHAEHVLEGLLDRAPDIFLYPCFKSVGITYFVRTRSSPFHVVGLYPQGLHEGEPPPIADNFEMMPSEFAWHDIGHIEFMAERDFEYIENTFKPIERVVQEWEFTKKRVLKFLDSYSGGNVNRQDAMKLILFEILHERGYQYSLSVLKAQLDTPKWTEILNRKLRNKYFHNWGLNPKLFDELEGARTDLLGYIDELRRSDQKDWIRTLKAEDLDVRVTHYPKIESDWGRLDRIVITGEHQAHFDTTTATGVKRQTETQHAVLAQVNPIHPSPLTADIKARINALLRARAQQAVSFKQITIERDGKVIVEMGDGARLPIAAITVGETYQRGPDMIIEREFFEMDQILGSESRKEPLFFTLHKPTQVYLGRVSYGMSNGQTTLIVHTKDGLVSVPLSEALVDPLQKGDFQKWTPTP